MNHKLIYPRQWMAFFCKCELWHEPRHKSWNAARGVIQHGSPGQGKAWHWGTEISCSKTSLLHRPRKQNGKTPQCTLHPDTEPRAWSSTRNPPSRDCAGIQETQNSLLRSLLWYLAQHRSAKWEGKEQEKQQQHKEGHEQMYWLQQWLPHQTSPKAGSAEEQELGGVLTSVSMENGKITDVTDLSQPTDLLSYPHTNYQPGSALQRDGEVKQEAQNICTMCSCIRGSCDGPSSARSWLCITASFQVPQNFCI